MCLIEGEHFERAEDRCRYALETLPPDIARFAMFFQLQQAFLAEALVGQSKFEAAQEAAEVMLARNFGKEGLPWQAALARTVLAHCLTQKGEFSEAEKHFDEASKFLQHGRFPPNFVLYRAKLLERQLELYEKSKQPKKAAEVKKLIDQEAQKMNSKA
jgi:tetratricopeptide (TPR) repeat protein